MTDTKPKWWMTIINAISEEVAAQLKAQNARIAALEARMDQFQYRGVWDAGTVYRQSNCVSDGGSMWICMAAQSTQRPGDGPDWRLAVKRGKDGRDVRP